MEHNFAQSKENGSSHQLPKLDFSGPLPLYYQLETIIKHEIANRTWKEEELIPSENELAATYGISVGSVRKAINGLVQDGILVRKQGKGTFVVPPNFRDSYIRFFNVTGDDPENYVLPSSQVLSLEIESPMDDVKKILKLARTDQVIIIKRLRRQRGLPVVLEEIFLSKKRFPAIDRADFAEDPVFPIYRNKYNLSIVGADEYFKPGIADQEVAAILGIKPGDPVIYIERIAYTHGDEPVEYRKCTGRGDIFRYHHVLGRRKVVSGHGF